MVHKKIRIDQMLHKDMFPAELLDGAPKGNTKGFTGFWEVFPVLEALVIVFHGFSVAFLWFFCFFSSHFLFLCTGPPFCGVPGSLLR